jgi:stage V sporulation protein B
MAEYASRVLKGTSVVLILAITGAIVGYLTRLYLARMLSVEDYGLFYAILSFLSIFTFLREPGLTTALAKYIPDFLARGERTKVKKAIFSVFVIEFALAVAIAIFFLFTADYWAVHYFKTEKAVLPLQIIALSFFTSALMSIVQVTFQGFGKMKYYAMVEFLRIIFVLIFVVGLIGLGVLGATYAYLIASVLVSGLMFFVALRVLPKLGGHLTFSKKITKKMFLFGIPIFLSSIGGIFVNYTDNLLLVYFRTLEEVGLYNVALPTSQLLWFFVGALTATLLPTVSELWARNKKETLKKGMSLLIKLAFFIIVPLAILMIAFADNIIVLFFGGKYIASTAA